MAADQFNKLRVDLIDIYRECEHRTSFHSRVYQANELNQEIVISFDDYSMLHSFANEASSLIANDANYIQCANQTGFEALTSAYTTDKPNPFDDKDLTELNEQKKQTGELLAQGEMDTLEFNIEELADVTINKYSIIQGFIRSAIIEYILFKWYSMVKINDESMKALQEFEKFKSLIRFNSITNKKTFKSNRKYRAY